MACRSLLLLCMLILVLSSRAQAAITFVAANVAQSANATSTTLAVNVPAGTVAGDVMLVQFATSRSASVLATPAGWTQIRSDNRTYLTVGISKAIYYRVATGSEPASYTFTSSLSGALVLTAVTMRGVDNTSPIFGHSGQAGSLLLSTAPSIAGCPAGAMQMGFFGFSTALLSLTVGPIGVTTYAGSSTSLLLGLTVVSDGQLMASAGTCPALTALAVSVTANIGQQVVLNPASTPVTIHHFEMNPPTTGLTCKAQNITVKACMDTACSTLYNGSVAVTLAPVSGWTAGSVQTLSSGTGTYAFQPTTAGSYTLSVSASVPALASGGGTTCPTGGNGTCTIQVYDSALVFSPTIPNQVAGLNSGTLTLAALGTDPATQQCIPAFANVTRTVSFWSSYVNPASGTKALTLTANPSGASSTSAISGSSPGTAFSLAFNASGQAQVRVNYPDVGRITLNALYTGSIPNGDLGLSMAGSASFTVKPYTLQLSNIKRVSDNTSPPSNPTNASSPFFARAGDSLGMTVTALNASGVATPNFGLETPAQGSVIIASLVAPATGTNATAQNSSGSSQYGGYLLSSGFSSGAATLSNLIWNEVGIMTLTPHVGTSAGGLDYLSTGDLGSGDGSVLTASANLGRFAPHRFVVSANSLTNRSDLSCSPASNFTYLGEPLRALFSLSAVAAGGSVTRNYDSTLGFSKMSSSTALGFAAADITSGVTTALSSRMTSSSQSLTWSSGVASVSQPLVISRATSPDGPFLNAYIGTQPADTDSTALASSALDLNVTGSGGNTHQRLGSTILRYGRLKLSNALGSEQLDLPIPAVLESWAQGFSQNYNDSCTVVLPSGIGVASLGNYLGSLTSTNMPNSNIQFGTAPVVANQGKVTLSLLKPSGGARGSVDLTMNLDTNGFGYLKGAAVGANFNASLQPWARATFGLYQTRQPVIYLRENY
ncbi:DUF6701 domain-containing protein [Chitinimonas sp. PSY-7]|uniref:DUF6701 domain-containing protein n=1 Tax=Chitinimonas sp. PSY-7 TaxID=3459088 RepID=UPI00403FF6E3